jgi:2-methylcitrate dehydratase PrpD
VTGVTAQVGGDVATTMASHALDLDPAALPEPVVRQARLVVADTLGVLCAASAGRAVRTAVEALAAPGGPCSVVGHDVRVAPEVAAFINGIGGHDVELDDLHSASRTHPAAVLVPTALAAAELHGGCRYGDLLAGIVAGYDIQTRLSVVLDPIGQYHRGFHPSAVTGAVGSAVCAGRILELSPGAMAACISLGVIQCSGLLTYYDDPSHMSKSFQTGMAARNGVTAALFARRGYHAAPDPFGGPHSMLPAFGGAPDRVGELVADLGERFEIASTTFKRHASCALTHASVDALLSLLDDGEIAAADIERIEVRLPHSSTPAIDGNPLWTHNIQHVLAVAAFERRIGVEHFQPRWTGDAAVRDLAARVSVDGSDELEARFPAHNGADVTVLTAAGAFDRHRDAPRGSPTDPLTESELRDKATALAEPVLGRDGAEALWEAAMTVPVDAAVDRLLFALAGGARS